MRTRSRRKETSRSSRPRLCKTEIYNRPTPKAPLKKAMIRPQEDGIARLAGRLIIYNDRLRSSKVKSTMRPVPSRIITAANIEWAGAGPRRGCSNLRIASATQDDGRPLQVAGSCLVVVPRSS